MPRVGGEDHDVVAVGRRFILFDVATSTGGARGGGNRGPGGGARMLCPKWTIHMFAFESIFKTQ